MNISELINRYLGRGGQEKPGEQGRSLDIPQQQAQDQGTPELVRHRRVTPKLTHFRHLVIQGFVGEPTAAELEVIEQELGTSLPDDFVEYLRAANGGSTEYSARVPPPDGEWIGMTGLFSTRPDKYGKYSYETFLDEILTARETQGIPPEVLPFARDGGGCGFYLDLTSEGQGRVVVFRSGLPAWTGRPSEDAFIPVAASFVDFIDSLSIETDYAEEILKDALASQDEQEIAVVKETLDSGLPGWREILGKNA